MSYFLKKSVPSKKGTYLQIYESYYVPGVGKRNKSYEKIGYVSDLINQGINDPISFYTEKVRKMNENSSQKGAPQISDKSSSKFAGHFLISSLLNELNVDNILNIIASNYKCHYKFSDMFRTLIYSQIISPGSKLKAYERVIPNILFSENYSYDQILDAINFIGSDYHKYIELLNNSIEQIWSRKTDKVYFDCTNYYFEIDLENSFLKKGPSKENRKCPLLGQALMLDAEQIPLDTKFYPGNQSEKPFLRERVEEMKAKNNIEGRVIQVADKGLNCARNIYSAVVESNDGYIFSKSIRGNSLKKEDKEWILKDDDEFNQWIEVRDRLGILKYKYKTAKSISKTGKILEYAKFKYKCKINPEDTHEEEFIVKEKRIVTYNPELAKKQRAEINKEVDKLRETLAYKRILKEELGDSAKYVNFEAIDQAGSKVKIATSLNYEKINNDLAFAGYNMLITSEINSDPRDIYNTYHNLWRIEESFRLLKTYLEARPVFLSDENTIYGHFLICYISLLLIRLLELKVFKDEIPAAQLFEFIRQYNVTELPNGTYINNSTSSNTYEKIKKTLGLTKLGNLQLSKKDLENLFKAEVI